ncbi:hypothetical protein Glove_99g186 [Diversispora epigaea]|uniref:F-box domain-containing protein n=1 Tax=Diversispora epigaea TaxID=1348612 RepID=A0A397J4D9_9GLOM|nr:hypothetical protein Glove_99g186 [Diversispora epigaea]
MFVLGITVPDGEFVHIYVLGRRYHVIKPIKVGSFFSYGSISSRHSFPDYQKLQWKKDKIMIYNLPEDISLEVLKTVLKQSKLKTFFKLRRVSKQWNKLIPLAVQYILYHQEERYWGISGKFFEPNKIIFVNPQRLAYDLRTKFVYLLSCDPIKIHFYKKEREQVICKYSVEYWDYNGKLEAMRSQWTLISPNIEAVKESGLYGEKNCRVIFKIEDKRLFKFVDRLSKFD